MIREITLHGETRTAVVFSQHTTQDEVLELADSIIGALDAVSVSPDSKDSMSAQTMSNLLRLFRAITSKEGGLQ